MGSIFYFIRDDLLYIRDGLDNSAPSMVESGPLSGYKGNNPVTVLEGKGDGVFLNFLSSSQVRTRGFKLWYEILGKIRFVILSSYSIIIIHLYQFSILI